MVLSSLMFAITVISILFSIQLYLKKQRAVNHHVRPPFHTINTSIQPEKDMRICGGIQIDGCRNTDAGTRISPNAIFHMNLFVTYHLALSSYIWDELFSISLIVGSNLTIETLTVQFLFQTSILYEVRSSILTILI